MILDAATAMRGVGPRARICAREGEGDNRRRREIGPGAALKKETPMNVAMILKDKGSKVHTVTSDLSVEEATQKLRELHVGALVAVNAEGKIAGVFSERDLVRAVHHEGAAALKKSVSTFMTKSVVTAKCDDTLEELMTRMTSRRIRHLPVIKGGELVGIVSIGDLVKARIAASESEAEALKQYISAG